jgi:hypothetical protein
MQTNTVEKNNVRDLSVGYTLAVLIYTFIGIFGSFGVLGRGNGNEHTIVDFFPN